jgi:hypothetical protein
MAPFWWENQLVWTKKEERKGELMIWRAMMLTKVQGKIQLKNSICFK